jgi:uncharacterized membrane protein
MSNAAARWPAAVALVGSALGLVLGGTSTRDYVNHLDRQVHDIHCSFIPGAAADTAENACQTAMYSPYSALMRDKIWGGIPISLLGVGAFAFFVAFSLYLLIAHDKAPRRAVRFLALTSLGPAVVSAGMAYISATELGHFCKTCVGMYIGAALLLIGGGAGWLIDRKQSAFASAGAPSAGSNVPDNEADEDIGQPVRALGGSMLIPSWLLALGLFSLVPAGVYYQSVPNYSSHVAGCGELVKPVDAKNAIRITPAGAQQPVVMLVDPLCPTCKAFHERLVSEGYWEKLDTTLVLFPLDSECNWNLTTPLHPGACLVAKAVLCDEQQPLTVLEWAYANQEDLLATAKSKDGEGKLMAQIKARFPALDACIQDKKTGRKLDEMVRFATDNKLPVATPQLFVGQQRLCDEDIDIGLPYALRRLAPALAQK